MYCCVLWKCAQIIAWIATRSSHLEHKRGKSAKKIARTLFQIEHHQYYSLFIPHNAQDAFEQIHQMKSWRLPLTLSVAYARTVLCWQQRKHWDRHTYDKKEASYCVKYVSREQIPSKILYTRIHIAFTQCFCIALRKMGTGNRKKRRATLLAGKKRRKGSSRS